MKKNFRNLIMLAVAALSFGMLATGAHADDACTPVRKVCLAAGFKMPAKGATTTQIKALRSQGLDLTLNCMRPLINSKAVNIPGAASLSSTQIGLCKTFAISQAAALKAASGTN